MMEPLYSPFFGLALTVGAYVLGSWINRKIRLTILNPLILATAMIIGVLLISPIDYAAYAPGAGTLAVFLIPATVCLAIPIYHKRALLKKYWLPVVMGCVAGAVVCIVCVWGLCKLFGLDDVLTRSLLPKSITTPFGMAVSESTGGIPSVTVLCIIITGIFGAIFAPYMVKWFRVTNPVGAGLAIGASSHVLGTSKALEIGETEGAMSGLAISITGITTVVILLLL
jgi:predicted murein hydrolase (TIGR00659 family)